MEPFAFVLIVVLLSAVTSASKSRGVSDDRQHLYEPYYVDGFTKPYWNCLSDPSIVLTYDQINDDYCDCPDGSDEPGTNACPYLPGRDFYCANVGYFPLYIESFKVNDGVCDYQDCCDGSDESTSGLCPNKCKEINNQFVEYETGIRKEVAKSLEAKNQILASASQAALEVKHKLALVRQNIKEAELKVAKLERSAEGHAEGVQSALAMIETKLHEIEHVFGDFSAVLAAQDASIREMESILLGLIENYNPNFNDQAVKNAVRNFQEYDSNKVARDLTSTLRDRVSAIISSASKIDLGKCGVATTSAGVPTTFHFAKLKSVLAEYFFGVPNETEQEPMIHSNAGPEELKKINDALHALRANANHLEQDLARDYGPNDILRGLQTRHVDGDLGGYNYHIEITGAAYQDNTILGKFLSIHDNKLYYENGSKCWNGPHRSAVVELVCGLKSRIISISEPEKCEYLIQLASPIACEEFTQQELLQSFKVDYSRL